LAAREVAPALTEEYRQQELERGRRSFWYFLTAILGLTADDEDGNPTLCEYHRDLCNFLEGRPPHFPYHRALVCCFRGGSKSVIVRMYALWRCLYIVNFSVLILSNSAENAKKVHFLKILDLLTSSRRAEYIRWLYQHRFPPGLAGSNSEQLKLIQTDAMRDAAISYAGIESALEGKHPDLVIIDDPEGADAEKSAVANADAWAAYQRVIPLLRVPAQSQIIIVATPWGDKPIVWRLRDENNWTCDEDNATSPVKIFWRPLLDHAGRSRWPQRFPDWYIDQLRKDSIFETQYMLSRKAKEVILFDLPAIIKHAYEFLGTDKSLLSYPGFKFDPDKVGEDGFVRPEATVATVSVRKLRFYLHFDPLHKSAELRKSPARSQRPATAAIAAVGIAPDLHAFVMETWTGTDDIDSQVRELMRMYRLYAPFLVTYEAIGAQIWLRTYIETLERQDPNWRRPKSAGLLCPPMYLPRLSLRLVEDTKTNESKEWTYREKLEPWLNHGTLHVNINQTVLLRQLEHVLNEDEAVDLIDCLAQGPEVWKPPAGDVSARDFEARRKYVDTYVRPQSASMAKTGFSPPPWRRQR
jgi:hypothetical protein